MEDVRKKKYIRFDHGLNMHITNMSLHGVFKALINGQHERGSGGFLFVKGDSCTYMFPRELVGQDDAKTTLTEMLEDENAKEVFYVQEERDGQLNVLAYPKDHVLKEIMEVQKKTTSSIEELD